MGDPAIYIKIDKLRKELLAEEAALADAIKRDPWMPRSTRLEMSCHAEWLFGRLRELELAAYRDAMRGRV